MVDFLFYELIYAVYIIIWTALIKPIVSAA